MWKPASASIAAAVTATVITVACDKTPTRPSFLPRPQGPPLTNRIELIGPDSIAPGETAQFTAVAHRSDGTTADVTSTAGWRSSQPAVLSVAGPGRITALTPGEATIQVVSGASATRVIFALPEGTFRLAGVVTEADSSIVAVAGAQIAVTGSAGAVGLSVLSGPDGRYRLYGVPPTAEIRVTKAGYQPVVQTISLSDHQTLNVTLPLAAPRADLGGTYTLLIGVANECREKLPQEVWTRRYTARAIQSGPLLDVSLTGATFVVDGSGKGDGFRGRIEPGRVVFQLDWYDYYYYRTLSDIVEEINPSLYLTVSGSISAAMTPGIVSGALNGSISTLGADPRTFPRTTATCQSPVHQFVLQR